MEQRRGPRSGVVRMLAAGALLTALAACAVLYVQRQGWTLYYGDAEAHLNIARRILDSRTPGPDQIGTVWLPLPHLMMLPFVMHDGLWRSGLAGAIPSAVCLVAAGLFLFAAVRASLESSAAAWTALAVFAGNPNLLYIAATPMTEAPLLAAWAALLWTTVAFARKPSLVWAGAAGAAACAASLTRYEGWFVLPFAALFFLLFPSRRRLAACALFCLIAGLGPLSWLAHNAWYYSNPLEFFNGPYSAKAIYQRALDAGMARYPGDHDWPAAARYYAAAVQQCAAWPLIAVAAVGLAGAVRRRAWWPCLLLALPPVFYVLSMYSSGTPIFLPGLWPNSYYNTRYALPTLPLLALLAGAAVLLVPARFRAWAPLLVIAAALAPWWIHPRPEAWIVWKESQVNSEARRAWTGRAAAYMAASYRPGGGIFTSFGDLTGIFRQAGIPLRETLHEGNGPAFAAALANPRFFLHEEWAVTFSGDPLATAILRCQRTGPRYHRVLTITAPHAPVIEIYRRD